MSGIVSHIAVGELILGKAGEKIKDPEAFVVGNIAPDAVHSRENYKREMKKISHLRQGIVDSTFLQKDNLKLFHDRLEDFVKSFCVKTRADYDFMCGYAAHLVTDELFIRTVRQEYVGKMEKIGVYQDDIEFFYKITRDMNGTDYIIAKKYPFKTDPVLFLEKPEHFEVDGFVRVNEINLTMKWIAENYFEGENRFKSPVYLTYEEVCEFIDNSSEEVYKWLSDKGLY